MSEPIYLTPDEVVARFQNRLSKKTLANWRVKGEGPEFVRFGNRILYLLTKVEEWEGERRFSNSGEHKVQRRAKAAQAAAAKKGRRGESKKPSSEAQDCKPSPAAAPAAPAVPTESLGRIDSSALHGACHRCRAGADYTAFEGVREVGIDPTDGRYADVSILRCRTCEALWVRYHVEYEARTGSGRWARGLIEEPLAAVIEPADVVAHLNALPSYAFGGSYFGHSGAVRSRPMNWS